MDNANLRNTFVITMFIFLIPLVSISQPAVDWMKAYGGSDNDVITASAILPDGSFLLTGYSFSEDDDVDTNNGKGDAWVMKINSIGNIIWNTTFGNAFHNQVNDISPTDDEGAILCGYTFLGDNSNPDNEGESQMWVFKIDKDGILQWSKLYGGINNEQANKVIELPNDDLLLGGTSWSQRSGADGGFGKADVWIMELTSAGNVIWSEKYGGSNDDIFSGFARHPNGNITVSAYTNSNTNDFSNNKGGYDNWLFQTNANGLLLWSKLHGGSKDDFCSGIQASNESGFVIGGYTYSDDSGFSDHQGLRDFWIYRTDTSGDLIWSKTFGGSGHDEATDIIAADDGYLLAGYSWSEDGDIENNFGHKDFWVTKVNENGALMWAGNYGGAKSDIANTIELDSDGYIFLAGTTKSTDNFGIENKGGDDAFLVKLGDVLIPLSVSLGSDVSICEGESYTLEADATNCTDCTYLWSNGATGNAITVTPEVTTTYAITVTDIFGNSAFDEVIIEVTENVQPIVNIFDISCNGLSDGSIMLEISGSGINYQWNTGATTSGIENLPAGNYTVTITQGNCGTTETIPITEPPAITLTSTITDACFNTATGVIETEASGGTIDLAWLWSTGSTEQNLINVNTGNYSVTVSDVNDCTYTESFTIDETAEITALSFTTPVICPEDTDGAIDLIVSGGTAQFSYQWSNGATTQNLQNIPGGEYIVTITDIANGCVLVRTVQVIAPQPIGFTSELEMPTNNEFNGSIIIHSFGGNLPHFITWSNGQEGPILNNLPAGTYTMTITDSQGCTFTEDIILDAIVPTNDLRMVTDFIVFPNPTSGIFYAVANFSENLEFELLVINALGQLLFKERKNGVGLQKRMDLSSYPTGVYFIVLKMEKEYLVKRIVKSNGS